MVEEYDQVVFGYSGCDFWGRPARAAPSSLRSSALGRPCEFEEDVTSGLWPLATDVRIPRGHVFDVSLFPKSYGRRKLASIWVTESNINSSDGLLSESATVLVVAEFNSLNVSSNGIKLALQSISKMMVEPECRYSPIQLAS